MSEQNTLVILRYDLRVDDHPALAWALERGKVIIAYIHDERFAAGGASSWFLQSSLESLNETLGGKINFYQGAAIDLIESLYERLSFTHVIWTRCYEPKRIESDTKLKAYIKDHLKLECLSFNGSLLWEPWTVLKKDKTPYRVFSPFYYKGALNGEQPRSTVKTNLDVSALIVDKCSEPLQSLKIASVHPWTKKLSKYWEASEKAAHQKLNDFISHGLNGYKELRNQPALSVHTSRLSPYLHFGILSPNQVWEAALDADFIENSKDKDHFLSELGWREFSYYLLYHFPDIINNNFQKKFDNFPWQEDEGLIKLWQQGKTGIPIVDAGMRELYETGYMHNRVRMIVASVLIKNLLQHWKIGRDWFDECLVDADQASNNASWQWVAGSGADAAPYFRIFNPVLQGEKFDPEGTYTKTWLPELKQVPAKFLHRIWEAPERLLHECGVVLGDNYPQLVVDLSESRDKALELYSTYVKSS